MSTNTVRFNADSKDVTLDQSAINGNGLFQEPWMIGLGNQSSGTLLGTDFPPSRARRRSTAKVSKVVLPENSPIGCDPHTGGPPCV